MKQNALLAIDQGTSSSRAIIFSEEGKIISQAQKNFDLIYPRDGWVEADARMIWKDSVEVTQRAIRKAEEKNFQVVATGITNQRETTVIWNKKTGAPVYNAIVWQDRRTAGLCAELEAAGHGQKIAEKTGLLIDPYFSATKIKWIIDHVEGIRDKAAAGELAFGTIDSWLLWNFTGGAVHATDTTNAARTLLYNIVEQKWDEELLALFDIPAAILPEVKDNVTPFGLIQKNILGDEYIIGGMAGDQHAAMAGQACFNPGMVKSTYGTGCFALMNIGTQFRPSHNRLLVTPAYCLDGEMTYAVEGSIFSAGSAVKWLVKEGYIQKAAESEDIAKSLEGNEGVYFVPAFTGLGAPYWEPDARPLRTGGGTDAHLVRAVLEAQAYQTLDLMQAMRDDSGFEPDIIRADGGLVANEFVCQFLADMLGRPVEVPENTEATAWGAAALGGLQAGIFKNLDDIKARWRLARRYEPKMDSEKRAALYAGWQNAVQEVLKRAKGRKA